MSEAKHCYLQVGRQHCSLAATNTTICCRLLFVNCVSLGNTLHAEDRKETFRFYQQIE